MTLTYLLFIDFHSTFIMLSRHHCFLITRLLVVLLSQSLIAATSADPSQSYDILYNQAVEAYLDENWDVCVAKMNEAIEDWHFYQDAVVGCRLKCQRDSAEQLLTSPQLEDMKLWERNIKQTLCILKCKKGILKNRAEIVAKNVVQDFENFKPYDYLQLCYFKVSVIANLNHLISSLILSCFSLFYFHRITT